MITGQTVEQVKDLASAAPPEFQSAVFHCVSDYERYNMYYVARGQDFDAGLGGCGMTFILGVAAKLIHPQAIRWRLRTGRGSLNTFWAALAALPFGWGVGLVVARLIMPGDVGQLPAVTIPIAIASGLIFALLPLVNARTRLRVLLIGGALAFALDSVM